MIETLRLRAPVALHSLLSSFGWDWDRQRQEAHLLSSTTVAHMRLRHHRTQIDMTIQQLGFVASSISSISTRLVRSTICPHSNAKDVHDTMTFGDIRIQIQTDDFDRLPVIKTKEYLFTFRCIESSRLQKNRRDEGPAALAEINMLTVLSGTSEGSDAGRGASVSLTTALAVLGDSALGGSGRRRGRGGRGGGRGAGGLPFGNA